MATKKEQTPKKVASKAATKDTTTAKKTVEPKAPTKKATAPKVAAEKVAAKPKATAKKTVAKSPKCSIGFQVVFSTRFGQSIFLVGNHPALGGNSDDKALALNYVDANHWSIDVELDLASLSGKALEYYYVVKNNDGSIEKSAVYHLDIPSAAKSVNITDAWNFEGFEQNAFSSDVFKVLDSKTIATLEKTALKKGTHQFKVKAPVLDSNQVVCIVGSHKALNNWNVEKTTLLFPDQATGYWIANITISKAAEPVQYKYGIYDIEAKAFVAFEEGENRQLLAEAQNAKSAILNDGFFRGN